MSQNQVGQRSESKQSGAKRKTYRVRTTNNHRKTQDQEKGMLSECSLQ